MSKAAEIFKQTGSFKECIVDTGLPAYQVFRELMQEGLMSFQTKIDGGNNWKALEEMAEKEFRNLIPEAVKTEAREIYEYRGMKIHVRFCSMIIKTGTSRKFWKTGNPKGTVDVTVAFLEIRKGKGMEDSLLVACPYGAINGKSDPKIYEDSAAIGFVCQREELKKILDSYADARDGIIADQEEGPEFKEEKLPEKPVEKIQEEKKEDPPTELKEEIPSANEIFFGEADIPEKAAEKKETIPAEPAEQKKEPAPENPKEGQNENPALHDAKLQPRICENCGKEFLPFHTEFKKNGRVIVAGVRTYSIECSEELWGKEFKNERKRTIRKKPDMEDWEPVVDELRRIKEEHSWSNATMESVISGKKTSGSSLAAILRLKVIPPITSRLYKMILDYLEKRGFKHTCER